MEIGEKSNVPATAGGSDVEDLSVDPAPGFMRLWVVDPRYVRVDPAEPLPYEILDEAGSVIVSGTVEDCGYIDIEHPGDGSISLRLDGEVLTVHDQRG
ncbi:MAG: hypothetical protein AAF799_00945 [Myxococcota bacterium]